MQKFDIIVIGSGPAGQRAAIQGAKCGRRVAVIEQREIIGGACVNTGTIPSKTMREAVMHLSGFQFQGIYGTNYHVKEKITMADLGFRVTQVIKTEVDVTQAQLSRNGVEVITGRASFLDATHVRVENSRGQSDLEAPTIIIATGTKPATSTTVPLNGRTIVNSDQILDIPDIPKTLIVVGGGVIGVEYTCMFAILGSRVILVEKRPRLLEFADSEMVEALSYNLRDHRVTMRLNEEVATVEDKGRDGVVARMKSNKIINGDVLLYAVGRQGNVDELNLAAAGLEADNRGRIAVDAEYRTKVPNIFAAGDIIGFPSLASVSMEQGRLAAANAVGLKIQSNPRDLSLRHLHHSRDFLHREDRRAVDRCRRSLRSRRGVLSRHGARADSRRHQRPAQADLPPGDARRSGRAHHRRRRHRTAAHRSGGDDSQRHHRLLRGDGLQLSDSGRVLQSCRIQRHQ